MKKQWLITLVGLTLALAAITGGGIALAGNGAGASEPKDSDSPTSSAVCTEEVPDCNDTLVIGPDEEGTIEPDSGDDGPYVVPERDIACGPDQGVAITSDGQVSCVDLGNPGQIIGPVDAVDMVSPGSPPTVEPAQ